jgi:hypothetical protein
VLEETIREATAAAKEEEEEQEARRGDGSTARDVVAAVDLVEELRGLFEREMRLARE